LAAKTDSLQAVQFGSENCFAAGATISAASHKFATNNTTSASNHKFVAEHKIQQRMQIRCITHNLTANANLLQTTQFR
jgi:hypothetical protein